MLCEFLDFCTAQEALKIMIILFMDILHKLGGSLSASCALIYRSKMKMFKIASSPQTALGNIQRFGREVEQSAALQGRLAYARAWYAHQDSQGEWQFGPSKFVGYDGLDAKQYIESAEQRDGRRTEAQLRQWFTVVDPSSQLYTDLSAALFAFLAKFGKTPSTKMRLNLLKAVHETSGAEHTDSTDNIVELIVAVAKSLPSSHLAKLRARIAA